LQKDVCNENSLVTFFSEKGKRLGISLKGECYLHDFCLLKSDFNNMLVCYIYEFDLMVAIPCPDLIF
jgi:hypothetical protein